MGFEGVFFGWWGGGCGLGGVWKGWCATEVGSFGLVEA